MYAEKSQILHPPLSTVPLQSVQICIYSDIYCDILSFYHLHTWFYLFSQQILQTMGMEFFHFSHGIIPKYCLWTPTTPIIVSVTFFLTPLLGHDLTPKNVEIENPYYLQAFTSAHITSQCEQCHRMISTKVRISVC